MYLHSYVDTYIKRLDEMSSGISRTTPVLHLKLLLGYKEKVLAEISAGYTGSPETLAVDPRG